MRAGLAALGMMGALLGGAQAQTASEVRAVQFALSQVERYRPGPEDGILGPLTQSAIDAYARSRAVEPLFWPVTTHMISLVSWRKPWTEDVDDAVRTALKRATLRGRAPVIRDERFFDVGGAQAACVLLRTTEGPRWLHFRLDRRTGISAKDGSPVTVLLATGPTAVPARTSQLWCSLGYVPGARTRQSGGSVFHWK